MPGLDREGQWDGAELEQLLGYSMRVPRSRWWGYFYIKPVSNILRYILASTMDAFFAPSTKKTNAGTPRDAFGDITNAQRKVNLCFPHETFGGDVTNAQRRANAGTPRDTLKLTEEHLS